MVTKWIVTLASLALLWASASSSLAIDVDKVVFGVVIRDTDGQWKWGGSKTVPFVPLNVEYGYALRVLTTQPVRVTEILTLPDQPKVWPIGPSEKISNDGRTVTSIRILTPDKDGVIGYSWTVATGDPLGDYALTILVEGVPVTTFLFEVVLPSLGATKEPELLRCWDKQEVRDIIGDGPIWWNVCGLWGRPI